MYKLALQFQYECYKTLVEVFLESGSNFIWTKELFESTQLKTVLY